jgi:hypothetical protein
VKARLATAALALAAGIVWPLVTFRFIGLPLLAVALFGLLGEKRWATPRHVAALVLAFVALAWSPIGVTLINADGPPHLVGCCCCAPYRDREAGSEMQRVGRCVLCSDLATGFEPRWYLIW